MFATEDGSVTPFSESMSLFLFIGRDLEWLHGWITWGVACNDCSCPCLVSVPAADGCGFQVGLDGPPGGGGDWFAVEEPTGVGEAVLDALELAEDNVKVCKSRRIKVCAFFVVVVDSDGVRTEPRSPLCHGGLFFSLKYFPVRPSFQSCDCTLFNCHQVW